MALSPHNEKRRGTTSGVGGKKRAASTDRSVPFRRSDDHSEHAHVRDTTDLSTGKPSRTTTDGIRLLRQNEEPDATLRTPNEVLPRDLQELLRLREECIKGDTDAFWTYGVKLSSREMYAEAAEHFERVAHGDYGNTPIPAYELCAAGEWAKAERHGRADVAFRKALRAGVPFADTAHYDALVKRGETRRACDLYPAIAKATMNTELPTAVVTEIMDLTNRNRVARNENTH